MRCVRAAPPCNNNKLLQFNLYNCWNIICWSTNTGSVSLINVYFYCTKVRAVRTPPDVSTFLLKLLRYTNEMTSQITIKTTVYAQKHGREKNIIMISFRTKKIAPTIPFPTMPDWLTDCWAFHLVKPRNTSLNRVCAHYAGHCVCTCWILNVS